MSAVSLQDVDWEANPAAGIFSRCDDSFLVARRGLMLTEYGKVDVRKAKARLLHGASLCGRSPHPARCRCCVVCRATRMQRLGGSGANLQPDSANSARSVTLVHQRSCNPARAVCLQVVLAAAVSRRCLWTRRRWRTLTPSHRSSGRP
jgi:hypothetical protein